MGYESLNLNAKRDILEIFFHLIIQINSIKRGIFIIKMNLIITSEKFKYINIMSKF